MFILLILIERKSQHDHCEESPPNHCSTIENEGKKLSQIQHICLVQVKKLNVYFWTGISLSSGTHGNVYIEDLQYDGIEEGNSEFSFYINT